MWTFAQEPFQGKLWWILKGALIYSKYLKWLLEATWVHQQRNQLREKIYSQKYASPKSKSPQKIFITLIYINFISLINSRDQWGCWWRICLRLRWRHLIADLSEFSKRKENFVPQPVATYFPLPISSLFLLHLFFLSIFQAVYYIFPDILQSALSFSPINHLCLLLVHYFPPLKYPSLSHISLSPLYASLSNSVALSTTLPFISIVPLLSTHSIYSCYYSYLLINLSKSQTKLFHSNLPSSFSSMIPSPITSWPFLNLFPHFLLKFFLTSLSIILPIVHSFLVSNLLIVITILKNLSLFLNLLHFHDFHIQFSFTILPSWRVLILLLNQSSHVIFHSLLPMTLFFVSLLPYIFQFSSFCETFSTLQDNADQST